MGADAAPLIAALGAATEATEATAAVLAQSWAASVAAASAGGADGASKALKLGQLVGLEWTLGERPVREANTDGRCTLTPRLFARGCAGVVVLPHPRRAVRETDISRHRRQVQKKRMRVLHASIVCVSLSRPFVCGLCSGGAVTQVVELSFAEFTKMSATLKEVAAKLDRL